MTAINTAAAEQARSHTNLVYLCCGHIQPVQRDQLPSRCEHCRESFSGCGYLINDASDAEELSQEVLGSKVISHANGSAHESGRLHQSPSARIL